VHNTDTQRSAHFDLGTYTLLPDAAADTEIWIRGAIWGKPGAVGTNLKMGASSEQSMGAEIEAQWAEAR